MQQMRQQQLITKKDLYTRYTYTCNKCNKTFNKILDKSFTLHKEHGEKVQLCKACAFNLIRNSSGNYLMHDGEIYHWLADGVKSRFCPHCGRVLYDDGTNFYCPDCSRRFYGAGEKLYYCPTCGGFHKKGVCMRGMGNNYNLLNSTDTVYLNIHTCRDSKSRAAKGNAKKGKYEELKKLPYQEERKLPTDIISDLEEFYIDNVESDGDGYFDNYFFWQPIEIDGTVEYKRYDGLKKFRKALEDIQSQGNKTSYGYKPSKYRNHFFQDISDDGLITWKYIDMYGGIREKKESINKFLKDNGLPQDTLSLTRKIYYRLSSDIYHKLKSFNVNHNLGSCQQPHNSSSYSTGAYDAITNGCNCPILLYNSRDDMEKDNNPIGRITSRIMYDQDGHMYILVDRLYQDGSLSGQRIKGMMYKLIIEDIKSKGYKVIVSNYSAHDDSTLQYLEALGMKKGEMVKNLWQPLRRLFDVGSDEGVCGYYSDGGIEVYQEEINGLKRASDFLDKAYLV